MITGKKRVLPRIRIPVIFSNGGSSVSNLDSEFSLAVIALNSSNSAKSFSSRMVLLMEWRISLPSSRRASKSSSRILSMTEGLSVSRDNFTYKEYEMRFMLAPSQSSVGDLFSCWEMAQISSRSQSKRAGGKNQLMKAIRSSYHVSIVPSLSLSSHVFASLLSYRIGFGSTIKMVSFDESQVVPFNGEFICGFRKGDCKIRSQIDNMVGSLQGFYIHGIEVLKGNEKVTEVIDVENWQIDNSRVLRRIVSLFEWNCSVSLTKSLIQYYPIWQVIQNGNGHVSVTTDTNGIIQVLPSKTAEEVVFREMKRKERTTLLMALLEDHLAKFHKMDDAKEMWEAIKSRFGGNDESKKMQKYLLK
nr:xylulose kinase-1 [Tanacetum cinerariifolium]